MADESLDEILSSDAPAPEVTETTTEQTTTTDNTALRDEHGRFAPKAAAAPETPAVDTPAGTQPEPEGNGTVPQQALHEARQKLKDEQDARANAERRLAALEAASRTPAAPVEPPKPVELWDNPEEFVGQHLTPLQEEIAKTRAFYSDRDAIREHGAETVTAAKAALGEAIRNGRMEDAQVTAYLKKSMDPVGEIVTWHKQEQAKQRVGNDPDAFVQSELDKMLADPAKRTELLARLNGTPAPAAVPGSTPTNITRLPPSLSRLPGGNADPVAGDESLETIIRAGRARA